MLTADVLHALARALNRYEISEERAKVLAAEMNGYLTTLEQHRLRLSLDDAPTDFDLVLVAESAS
jgi:hypothetical protein